MSETDPLWAQDVRSMLRAKTIEMHSALTRERSDFERRECLVAYRRIINAERDAIYQRHGMPGLLHRIVETAP